MTKILSKLTADSLIKKNGTSSQLLRADGSTVASTAFSSSTAFVYAITGESELVAKESGWFISAVNTYMLGEMTEHFFAGDIDFVKFLSEANGYRVVLMTDEVDMSRYGKGFTSVITALGKAGYNVYIENDVEELISNGYIAVFKFTVERMKVIVECYRRIV